MASKGHMDLPDSLLDSEQVRIVSTDKQHAPVVVQQGKWWDSGEGITYTDPGTGKQVWLNKSVLARIEEM